VTLDETGHAIAASDHVLVQEGELCKHESVGGRLERDGRFLGTRWHTVTREAEGRDEGEVVEAVSSKPSDADERNLKALVAEVLRRTR